jgi:hypothetical protein
MQMKDYCPLTLEHFLQNASGLSEPIHELKLMKIVLHYQHVKKARHLLK